jgi:quinol monooxygenase YgiN
MLIVHVFVHFKPECVAAFRAATVENARNSVQEPGIARFDVIQQQDDPRGSCWSRFTARRRPRKHKETAHYRRGGTRWST